MIENPLAKKLKDYNIVLGSGSPRRQQFFKELGLRFEVRVKSIDEYYPEHLKGAEIPDFLAKAKAHALLDTLSEKEILVTSDTVVWHKGRSLEKAANKEEAFAMLKTLSNDWHEVITSVCFSTIEEQKLVNHTTHVKLAKLDDDEITYYIEYFKPFDKAGAYGIQEWIGLIGIEEIKGAYTNVVGLPTQLVYKTLTDMVS
ncbi:MAG: septum formation protein Maf [Muricauda sp.]|nr:Maf family nucleotide pyrophosphatase [Allomuricauda sp.]MBC30906.1 septum formation protein Maf [Allomuricauda sp.]|tara:strand:- start:66162 stop:66761 length:600 start_codon:yes stop_codon:yes gene_type:complete